MQQKERVFRELPKFSYGELSLLATGSGIFADTTNAIMADDQKLARWGMRVSYASLAALVLLFPILVAFGLGMVQSRVGEFIGGLLGIFWYACAGWGVVGSLVCIRHGRAFERWLVAAPFVIEAGVAILPFMGLVRSIWNWIVSIIARY